MLAPLFGLLDPVAENGELLGCAALFHLGFLESPTVLMPPVLNPLRDDLLHVRHDDVFEVR